MEVAASLRSWVVALAFGLAASVSGPATANTIQPILIAESGPVSGEYTYTYDIQLTPNNYLQNASAAPVNFPSSLTLFDFGVVSGTPTLAGGVGLYGADVTTTSQWAPVVTSLTGSSVPDSTYIGVPLNETIISSSNGSGVLVPDNSSLTNITLQYTGGFVSASSLQRSLIQLQIVSTLAPNSQGVLVASVDGVAGSPNQVAENFTVSTTTVTSSVLPEPASLSLLAVASVGLLRRRRRRFKL